MPRRKKVVAAPTGPLPVVLYLRVSTDKQENGPEVQEAKLRAYAALHGLSVLDVVADDGQTGKTMSRPGLMRALGLLRSGAAGGIVVAKLDRLTRSLRDWQELIEEFFGDGARCPASLMSVGDSIDTRTASGRLVLNVLISVAQWERETIVERTKDALENKRSKGEAIGGTPFGYSKTDTGKLVPHKGEQAVLQTLIGMRRNGDGFAAIAAEANRLGLPPKGEGARWHKTTVSRVLARAGIE